MMQRTDVVVGRGELDVKLAILSAALRGKDTAIEQVGHIMLGGNYISAYDGEVSVHAYVEAELPSTCVHAKPFIDLVKRASDANLSLLLEGDNLVIKGGRSRATLPTKHLSHPFPISEMHNLEWVELPANFTPTLISCAQASSTDASGGILTYVRFEGGEMVGCDRHRLTRKTISDLGLPPIYIPASKVSVIAKHKPSSIAQGHGMLHFLSQDGDCLSIAMRASGNYPNIQRVIDVSSDGSVIVLPTAALFEALERCEVVASESDAGHQVSVAITDGKMVCSASSQHGKVVESMPCDYEGGEISFSIHIEHLKVVLTSGVDGTCVNSERMLKFEANGFEYVVCKASQQDGRER